jgi:hypothetical protein
MRCGGVTRFGRVTDQEQRPDGALPKEGRAGQNYRALARLRDSLRSKNPHRVDSNTMLDGD